MNLSRREIIVSRIRVKLWLILVGPWLCLLQLIGLIFEFNPSPLQELIMWKTRRIAS